MENRNMQIRVIITVIVPMPPTVLFPLPHFNYSSLSDASTHFPRGTSARRINIPRIINDPSHLLAIRVDFVDVQIAGFVDAGEQRLLRMTEV